MVLRKGLETQLMEPEILETGQVSLMTVTFLYAVWHISNVSI